MYHHKLIISYKGTNYFGWQEQSSSQQKITVQSTLQKVLNKICKYQNCILSVASRTDAGVHALGQVVKISIPLLIASEKLLLGMNSLLPDDIRILQCDTCLDDFNANKDSTSKEYHYYFCTDTVYNPVLNDIVVHIPSFTDSLDIKLMQEACTLFIGTHDFYSFAKRDTTINSTVRTILSCEIVQGQSSALGNNTFYLKIVGEGFLRYMVRYIVGALFELGKKKLCINDIKDALINPKDEKISSKAKSKGLHLIQISY